MTDFSLRRQIIDVIDRNTRRGRNGAYIPDTWALADAILALPALTSAQAGEAAARVRVGELEEQIASRDHARSDDGGDQCSPVGSLATASADPTDEYVVGLSIEHRMALFIEQVCECAQLRLTLTPKDIREVADAHGIWGDPQFAEVWKAAFSLRCDNIWRVEFASERSEESSPRQVVGDKSRDDLNQPPIIKAKLAEIPDPAPPPPTGGGET